MDVTLKGKVLTSQTGKELLFRLSGSGKIMKLDLFTGCKLFRCTRGLKIIQKSICEIFQGNRFEATGYCYNSETMIVDTIQFDKELKEKLFTFLDIVKDTRSKK